VTSFERNETPQSSSRREQDGRAPDLTDDRDTG
jgi:hypothetical protein